MLRIIPITLDISKVGSQKTVTGIRRNDSNTVKFAISLVDGSSPVNLYDLGSATIIMFGLKPDGKIIINYAEFDYSENKIVYTLNAQDTSAAGVVKWQVKIFENANTVFATPEFASVIDGDSVDGDDIDSRDSVKALYEAIEYVNELITNNNLSSRYSFMFDIQGRIFSYTWDTDISPNSFAKYSKYEEKINAGHIVWLASNVTNVQSGALGNADKVSSIRCEAPQDKITLNDYSECNVQYGSSTLSQFYILATISWLLNEKADTPVELSSLSSNVQDLITNSLRRTESTVNNMSQLNWDRYLRSDYINTLYLQGNLAEFFEVDNGTRAEMNVIGSLDTYITRIITFPGRSVKWVQIVEPVEGSSVQRVFGEWTKKLVDEIADDIVTLSKFTPGLREKFNYKIDSFIRSSAAPSCFDLNLLQHMLYYDHVIPGDVDYLSFVIESNDTTNKTQFRLSTNGIEWRKKTYEGWSEWTLAIPSRQITENHLTDELNAVLPKVTVWDIQTSIENNFSVPTTYAGKLGDIVVVTSLSVGSGGIIYQLTRTLTQSGTTLYYWTDITTDTSTDKMQLPDYSIAFNSDGVMIKSSNSLTLGGGDFNSECSSVYVSQKVTSINNTFFVTAPNITDLYIDNNEGAVTLPSNIPATVTVHYKDEFKLSDLLVNSAIASNTKLLNLENTFNGLINGDEVAY